MTAPAKRADLARSYAIQDFPLWSTDHGLSGRVVSDPREVEEIRRRVERAGRRRG